MVVCGLGIHVALRLFFQAFDAISVANFGKVAELAHYTRRNTSTVFFFLVCLACHVVGPLVDVDAANVTFNS